MACDGREPNQDSFIDKLFDMSLLLKFGSPVLEYIFNADFMLLPLNYWKFCNQNRFTMKPE